MFRHTLGVKTDLRKKGEISKPTEDQTRGKLNTLIKQREMGKEDYNTK